MQDIAGTLNYTGRPPAAAVLVEFLDSAGKVVSSAVPDRDGGFSLLTQRDEVTSVRLVVGGKAVNISKLPTDPTKLTVPLPA